MRARVPTAYWRLASGASSDHPTSPKESEAKNPSSPRIFPAPAGVNIPDADASSVGSTLSYLRFSSAQTVRLFEETVATAPKTRIVFAER